MESLDGTDWDVVIVGTGVSESLLALSLSRSGKRILHLDPNDYYGGDEAALSLQEAEAWAERHRGDSGTTFSHAECVDWDHPQLGPSRAYSLALAPHLIYSRSNFISTVVSAHLHNQLEFQAVGSWFVLDPAEGGTTLVKVPGGREDVFADTTLDLKSKRALMKFLRFVAEYEDKREVWEDDTDTPFPMFLKDKFALPQASHGAILALTMSEHAATETGIELALSRIAQHARSIGTFGPGFGAVLPKWGGLAEVTQVACRACAVGGGVYVLGKGVDKIDRQDGDHPFTLTLDHGSTLASKFVASSKSASSSRQGAQRPSNIGSVSSKSISVVSSPLSKLFPPTSEGGVTPAGAVVVVSASSDKEPPVHIFAHTSEAGECPIGQCILYASVAVDIEQGRSRLDAAVTALLGSINEDAPPAVMWRLQYQQTYSRATQPQLQNDGSIVMLPSLSSGLALEDDVLEGVRTAWQRITGDAAETFMKFESRESAEDNDD